MALLAMVLYLIRIVLLGGAIGTAFIQLKLFAKLLNGQVMLLGVASTPMFISLIDYLLGLVFIGWSSWLFFLMPVAISLIYLLAKKNYQIALESCKDIWDYFQSYIKSIGTWMVFDEVIALSIIMFYLIIFNGINPNDYVIEIFYALNVVGYLTAAVLAIIAIVGIIIIFRRMLNDGTLERNLYLVAIVVVVGTASTHALSMIGRPVIDSDRSHYELDARYFHEDKNSWEVDNYTDEKYGSSHTDDHGPLWVMYLADAYMVADVAELDDQIMCVNIALLWAHLCLYFFIFLAASYIGESYRTGVIALMLYNLYFYTIVGIIGGRDAFRFVGLMLLFMYVINQYDKIVEGKINWYAYPFMFLFCFLSMNGHEGNVYIMLGMFIVFFIMLFLRKAQIKNLLCIGASVLFGTILGITKTIRIYLTTGEIASSTLLPFYGTPVVEQMKKVHGDRADIATILNSYSYSVRFMIVLGIAGLIVIVAMSIMRKNNKELTFSLIIVGMLLPMTGIMNWLGYDVSLWFFEQYRYRLYFLMLFSITGAWLVTRRTKAKLLTMISACACVFVVILFARAETIRSSMNKDYVNNCKELRYTYEKMADIIVSVTDGNAFTDDQVLLYYLHGTPKLLFHPYTEDLIQAKTDEEVEAAMDKLNVGAILLPENGLDYHDYSLLPFWNYINNEKYFSKIKPEDYGGVSDKVIFYRNK